ncbi:bacterioferritin-associated ferredoxin [Psychrobacter sp. I-STPA6b]|uniref:(2Fe-2S)-binding protein n=1 Tax=Psychrobacter sp. I-STPA6b TaxID=2585718 RepID=UPI001D0C4B25|nr:(2Fe-2S)-binding protein [Psychrobacter sp. I-STPA6b]
MYVCICNDVKERQIKTAIAAGVDTLDGLKSALDVATCCGCCEPMVNDYLDEHHKMSSDANLASTLAYAV